MQLKPVSDLLQRETGKLAGSAERHTLLLDSESKLRNGKTDGTSFDAMHPAIYRVAMTLYLTEWRESAGLTLEQLGNSLGKHFTTVQKWEKGVNALDTRELERLAEFYGVHPSALYFHPNDRSAAERLQKAFDILQRMSGSQAEVWLQTGDLISKP